MADDNQSDDFFGDLAKKLREMLQQMQTADGKSNPLLELLSSFLSFFEGINDDSDAPDFEDITDPKERAAAEKAYEGRAASERAKYGDFRASAHVWTAADVLKTDARLVAMREAAEKANGGQPLKAICPVNGPYRVSSPFGHRESPGGIGSTEHPGVDFAPVPAGTLLPIISSMPGVVVGVGVRGGYGNMIEIMDIYGVKHRYGHLSATNVTVGQQVQQGQEIATMGTTGRSTGPHLHYEDRDGDNVPRDPLLTMDLHGHAIVIETDHDHAAVGPVAKTATVAMAKPGGTATPPAAKPHPFGHIELPQLASLPGAVHVQHALEMAENAGYTAFAKVQSVFAGFGVHRA